MRPFDQPLISAVVAIATAAASFSQVAWGETFVLAHGGQIQGAWLNPDNSAAGYQIQTEAGGRIQLDRSQVKEVIRQRSVEVEYERLAPTYRDTVEEQWKLAEWCRQNSLSKQRENHLRRIIELDETVSQAWLGLGYSQIGSRWVAKGEVPRENGMELYQGRWRLQQEIELLEAQAAIEQAEKDWQTKLKRIRQALVESDKTQQARVELLAIRDPHAVRPLTQLLAAERLRALRLLYVEVLAKINSTSAHEAIIAASLQYPDIEVFHACVAEILRLKPPGVTEIYMRALRHENNERVNRAAYVLAQLDDKSAIGPLIDALITSHKIMHKGRGNPDAMSATFGKLSDGSGNELSSGQSFSRSTGPTVQVVRAQNQEVLNALTKLAHGTNYGFDQASWKNWFGVQKLALPTIETRRSEN